MAVQSTCQVDCGQQRFQRAVSLLLFFLHGINDGTAPSVIILRSAPITSVNCHLPQIVAK